MNKGKLYVIALVLVLIGALNWGFVGVVDLNLVEKLLGHSLITKLVYVLVGLSAVYVLYVDGKNFSLDWNKN
jgi:uncharacterized membrane protein YuzA (DUF378 family)